MFPPVPTEDIYEMLRGLYQCLRRASDHLDGEYRVIEDGDTTRVLLKTSLTIPPSTRKILNRVIRQYAEACGWAVKTAVKRGHVELNCSYCGALHQASEETPPQTPLGQ